jgi:predicted Fe-Mo cluster-binding NifX family protein
MRIVVTSQGPELDAPVDPRFGRAAYLVLVDTDTGEHAAIDNRPNLNATQGAGIQAGRKVVEAGGQAVVTGHVGPKAFAALRAGKIEVYTVGAGTVRQAVEDFGAGRLQRIDEATVQGHGA